MDHGPLPVWSSVKGDMLVMVKYIHIVAAMLVWEIATTLDFEWSFVTGARAYKRTIWLYSGCRLSALVAAVLILVDFNASARMDCKAWLSVHWLSSGCALVLVTLLIILRVLAIWKWNRFVVVTVIGSTLPSAVFLVQSLVGAKVAWDPVSRMCLILNPENRRFYVWAVLGGDVTLFALMLAGLLRLRVAGTSARGVWHVLYTQGIQWVFVVMMSEVPPAAMLVLNFSDPWDLIFTFGGFVFPVIGATRQYRGLLTYSNKMEVDLVSRKSS
ncbi:hypothetical protein FA95DRAFT_1557226, partial [Auriscalpium vulgare]